jgi:hypothetical protein
MRFEAVSRLPTATPDLLQSHFELFSNNQDGSSAEKPVKYVSYAERAGIEKGIKRGVLMGQIWLCQRLLKQEKSSKLTLVAMPLSDLEALRSQLRKLLLPDAE